MGQTEKMREMRQARQRIAKAHREAENKSIYVTIETTRDRADYGGGSRDQKHWLRDVCVEPDGECIGWDDIGEMYSRCVELTEAEIAQAQRLAAARRNASA